MQFSLKFSSLYSICLNCENFRLSYRWLYQFIEFSISTTMLVYVFLPINTYKTHFNSFDQSTDAKNIPYALQICLFKHRLWSTKDKWNENIPIPSNAPISKIFISTSILNRKKYVWIWFECGCCFFSLSSTLSIKEISFEIIHCSLLHTWYTLHNTHTGE